MRPGYRTNWQTYRPIGSDRSLLFLLYRIRLIPVRDIQPSSPSPEQNRRTSSSMKGKAAIPYGAHVILLFFLTFAIFILSCVSATVTSVLGVESSR